MNAEGPEPRALFIPNGDEYIPTVAAVGPWSPDLLAGGPVGALLVRAAESTNPNLSIARVTCDFLRPVPTASLSIRVRCIRPGKTFQLLECLLVADGEVVAQALVANVAQKSVEAPCAVDPAPALPTPPEVLTPTPPRRGLGHPGFATLAFEQRHAYGHPTVPGAATVWFRLAIPLIPDEEPSGATKAVIAADGGYGWSWIAPPERFGVINTDLTVNLHRTPRGAWIGVEARNFIERDGRGAAESRLFDESGNVGRASQTMVVRAPMSGT